MKIYNRRDTKERRRALRQNMTDAERLLWSRLRGKQIGYKFRKQHAVGPYIVDFYCAELLLAIELDGAHHIEKVEKEKVRDAWLQKQGLTVLRYPNHLLFADLDAVVRDIFHTCDRLADDGNPL